MTRQIIDFGDMVFCDICNKEYTNLSESGGILFGSNAYCPSCSPRLEIEARRYNETSYIKARCPKGMSFKDWVLQLRGGNNHMIIESF